MFVLSYRESSSSSFWFSGETTTKASEYNIPDFRSEFILLNLNLGLNIYNSIKKKRQLTLKHYPESSRLAESMQLIPKIQSKAY